MKGLVCAWEAASIGAGERRSAQREGGRKGQGACGAARTSRRLWEGAGTRAPVTEGWRQRKMGTVCCDSESRRVGQDQAVKQGPAYICYCENNKIEVDPEFVSLNTVHDFQ